MIIHALIRDSEEMFDAERRFDTQFPDEIRIGPVQVEEGKDGSMWVAAEVADRPAQNVVEASPLFDELKSTTIHQEAEDHARNAYMAIASGDLTDGIRQLQKAWSSAVAADRAMSGQVAAL